MANDIVANYIRAHRRRMGLTQRQLGALVGYQSGYAVGRHERGKVLPPLEVALAYEAVFGVSVAQIFRRLSSTVQASVRKKLPGVDPDEDTLSNQLLSGGDAS